MSKWVDCKLQCAEQGSSNNSLLLSGLWSISLESTLSKYNWRKISLRNSRRIFKVSNYFDFSLLLSIFLFLLNTCECLKLNELLFTDIIKPNVKYLQIFTECLTHKQIDPDKTVSSWWPIWELYQKYVHRIKFNSQLITKYLIFYLKLNFRFNYPWN